MEEIWMKSFRLNRFKNCLKILKLYIAYIGNFLSDAVQSMVSNEKGILFILVMLVKNISSYIVVMASFKMGLAWLACGTIQDICAKSFNVCCSIIQYSFHLHFGMI